MNEVYDDIRQIRGQLTELVSTTVENTTILKSHTASLSKLQEQMETALIPIRFTKWAFAVVSGLATICGIVWGGIKGIAYAMVTLRSHP